MNNTLEYTTILHRFRINNGLSLLEYCFCDMVYFLSTNKNNVHDGWCWMEKQKQSENLGISRQSLLDIEKKMTLNGFIEKDDRTSWTRTTKKWDEVYLKKDYDLHDVKKLDTIKKEKQCKESLHDDVKKLDTTCKETLRPTYNIYNNKEYNYILEKKTKNEVFEEKKTITNTENNTITPEAILKEKKVAKKKEISGDLSASNLKDDKLLTKDKMFKKSKEKTSKKEFEDVYHKKNGVPKLSDDGFYYSFNEKGEKMKWFGFEDYLNVCFSEKERIRLRDDYFFDQDFFNRCVKTLSIWKFENQDKAKKKVSDYLCVLNWVITRVKKDIADEMRFNNPIKSKQENTESRTERLLKENNILEKMIKNKQNKL